MFNISKWQIEFRLEDHRGKSFVGNLWEILTRYSLGKSPYDYPFERLVWNIRWIYVIHWIWEWYTPRFNRQWYFCSDQSDGTYRVKYLSQKLHEMTWRYCKNTGETLEILTFKSYSSILRWIIIILLSYLNQINRK